MRVAGMRPLDTSLLCSVIVPVYDGAGVIARCLDALAAQTVAAPRFEIVVVDDGSRDATPEVVSEWARVHPDANVRLATQTNTGPAGARNHGAHLANAPLLLFTDADCVPDPGWIAAFLDAFAELPVPAAAMGAYRSAQRSPAARFSQIEFEERYAMMRRHATIDFVATYSAAYRRDAFLAAGGFDRGFTRANNEDTELAYRLSAQGQRMVFVPGAVVQHEHDETWADYFRTKVGRGYWRAIVYRLHPAKAVRDSYTPQLMKLQLPLLVLTLFGAAGALFARRVRWLLLALPFLASTLPMARFAWRQEPGTALWVPWGAAVRAAAFLAGLGQAVLSRRGPAPTHAAPDPLAPVQEQMAP